MKENEMNDFSSSDSTVRCGICEEAIDERDETIVTAMATLHVACVEESAAAA
jgi:ribosomal protein S27E